MHSRVAGRGEVAHHRRQPAQAVAVAAHRAQRHELADAVVDVDHEIPHLEVAQAGEERPEARAPRAALELRLRQDLLLAIDHHAGRRQPEASPYRSCVIA